MGKLLFRRPIGSDTTEHGFEISVGIAINTWAVTLLRLDGLGRTM
jgi:hypothetical protein